MESGNLRLDTLSGHRLARALAVGIGTWLLIAGLLAMLTIGPTVRGATHTVGISNFAFQPASLTIAVGDTVTWTNSDDVAHTATSTDGTFASGNLDPGQSFSFTFTSAGTFAYACDYHAAMQGTITVQAAAAPTATATAAQIPSTAMRTDEDRGAADTTLVAIGVLLIASAILLPLVGRTARRRQT